MRQTQSASSLAEPCFVTRAEDRTAARIDARASSYEAARTLLANEFVNAFRAGGDAKVSTPGWNKPTAKLVDVLSDAFAGTSGDEVLAEIIGVLGAAAKGEAVTFRAMSLIARMAADHADFHADDLADQIGGEA